MDAVCECFWVSGLHGCHGNSGTSQHPRSLTTCSGLQGAGQHRGPVWGLKWSEAEASKALSFISVAADGRVALWVLSKNQLAVQDVLSLSAPAAAAAADASGRDGDDKASLTASGLCFDFHKVLPGVVDEADALVAVQDAVSAQPCCCCCFCASLIHTAVLPLGVTTPASWCHQYTGAHKLVPQEWCHSLPMLAPQASAQLADILVFVSRQIRHDAAPCTR